jgi:hypothetical protein
VIADLMETQDLQEENYCWYLWRLTVVVLSLERSK